MSSRVITLPNFLTVIRMVLIPVFVTLLVYQRYGWALFVFVAAGVTDGLDGLLARNLKQGSELGRILDPIADKLMLVTAFIALSQHNLLPHPLPRHFPIPFWVTAAVISRDIFIIVGAAAINIVTGFRGFRPSLLGKASTVVQVCAIILVLVAVHVPWVSGYVLPTVYATVFLLAIASGIHYVFHASRLLNEKQASSSES
ncbi:MAG: CDP-alcohol phosphatidyltransferase family protein [Acidobacteria bacterium]|nr:MAG: CDP-alcohol phosphatidyltransferase family protein [Acidobacteriota bacterium]